MIAHHLELILLPADDRFLDEDFVDGGELESARDEFDVFFAVVGDAAPGAAEREAGADDAGQADLVADFERCPGERLDDEALGHLEADLDHRFLELLAIFGLVDDVGSCADHLDAELCEDAVLVQVHRGVEAGLAAERRQQGVGAFLLDDLGDDFPGDRLDVGAVGRLRVGHDGGGIGVDEDDGVALFAQGLARLGAGVIELARLPDDDGTRADEEDFLEIGTLRHSRWYPRCVLARSASKEPLACAAG